VLRFDRDGHADRSAISGRRHPVLGDARNNDNNDPKVWALRLIPSVAKGII
jgi:hypothetical protein